MQSYTYNANSRLQIAMLFIVPNISNGFENPLVTWMFLMVFVLKIHYLLVILIEYLYLPMYKNYFLKGPR